MPHAKKDAEDNVPALRIVKNKEKKWSNAMSQELSTMTNSAEMETSRKASRSPSATA